MLLLLLAIPILLPIVLALFGVGQRLYYIALLIATFILAILTGLMGRDVKSEVLFGAWTLIVAACLGCVLASLVYRRR